MQLGVVRVLHARAGSKGEHAAVKLLTQETMMMSAQTPSRSR